MFSLIPRDRVFFNLFEEAARNAHAGAVALLDLLVDYRDTEMKTAKIRALEHEGDRITHDTIERLNQTFITPLDREDIHELICRIDDILDHIDAAATRLGLYRITAVTDDAIALGRVLVEATKIIAELLPQMRQMKRTDTLIRRCIDIHTQENEGDRIEQHALASLFEGTTDTILVIKWKDIYQDLEAASDRCEDVANVIEGIILKNA